MIRFVVALVAILAGVVGVYQHGVDVGRVRERAAQGARLADAVRAETLELDRARASAQAERDWYQATLETERAARIDAARDEAADRRTMIADLEALRRLIDENPAPGECLLTGDRLRVVRDGRAAAIAYAGGAGGR